MYEDAKLWQQEKFSKIAKSTILRIEKQNGIELNGRKLGYQIKYIKFSYFFPNSEVSEPEFKTSCIRFPLLYLIPYVILPVVPDSIYYATMLNGVIAIKIGSPRMGATWSDTVGRDQSPVSTH